MWVLHDDTLFNTEVFAAIVDRGGLVEGVTSEGETIILAAFDTDEESREFLQMLASNLDAVVSRL